MSTWDGQYLREPISPDRPCGEDLEDTPLLASFDEFRLYGRNRPLEPPAGEPGDGPRTLEDRDERPPDWNEIKARSLEALAKSRDLRLLAHLGAALLRTDGLGPFADTISIAAHWLEHYWDQSYPLVDGDGILRRSALNCFADPMAVIDGVRRTPIVRSRLHGAFSLRDIEIATGQAPSGQAPVDEARVSAAFAAMPVEELTALQRSVSAAMASLKWIDDKMRSDIGTEAAPGFDPLSVQLGRIDKVLRTQLAARGAAATGGALAEETPEAAGAEGVQPAAVAVGVIRTREDAIRTLDAVAEFFRKNEPSSPVPLFCDRAKRLVARNFLEILEDVVPEAVSAARAAGGLKSSE